MDPVEIVSLITSVLDDAANGRDEVSSLKHLTDLFEVEETKELNSAILDLQVSVGNILAKMAGLLSNIEENEDTISDLECVLKDKEYENMALANELDSVYSEL